MVFYRKYRSQKIDELDSTHVRQSILSILSKEPPHAFLFTGPKGLGKTSAARIVAKAVNCEKKKQEAGSKNQGEKKSKESNKIEPCNKCEQCVSITNGMNMDVMEIDAASNRGIDEIRDLREKIWLAPLSASKKVYIIDEVHMLTTEAFNALLKTIEEPPDHAMFVLCTTEPQKVPATIISRCFHVQFNLATEDEIVRSIKRIVIGEKMSIDDDVLPLIAQRSEGGFRDAAKILEELSLKSNEKKITKESFEKLYKTSTILLKVMDFLAALKARDTKSGLQVVTELVNEGVDLKFFIAETLMDLHKKLLINLGVGTEQTSQLPVNLRFEVNEIKSLSELLNKAYQEMKFAVLPQLPLELAIIEFIDSEKTLLSGAKQKAGDEVTVATLRKEVGGKLMAKALYGNVIAKPGNSRSPTSQNVAADDKKKISETVIELMHVPANGEVTKEWMDALWKGIIEEMRKYNHTIAGVLRGCRIVSYDNLPAGRQGKLLVIGAAYEFHKERLDDKKARQSLRSVCKMLTGNDVEIEVKLNNKS